MKRKFVSLVLLMGWVTLVHAREYWLQPDKFIFKPGDNLLVSLNAGENFIGNTWNLGRQAITRLEHFRQNKSSNLIPLIKEGEKSPLTIPLREEGTHLILMESNNALIETDGEQFNEFLRNEGLDEVYDHRQRANTLGNPVKELYSCHTKLLVQVGERRDETFKKADGFPVEIIPEQNPYTLKKGDPVRFKIQQRGKPLFGVRVKVWNRYNNRTTLQNIYTEKNGMIETRVSNPGPWMVTVVTMVPSKQPGVEWQSHRMSLVFGIEY